MNYLNDFMNECISSGRSSVQDITEAAKQKIKYIEIEIEKIDSLKKEEKALKSLLKQLGGDTDKNFVERIILSQDFNLLNSDIKNISHSIIEFVSEHNDVSVQNIIEATSGLENSRLVLTALKWLIDNKIISRNEKSRKISRGEQWDLKEKKLNLINLKS
jgi:hypothetical protein